MKKWREEKIAVLAGGPSCEREISLISGKAVTEGLKAKGFDCVMMDPAGDFVGQLKRQNIHFVFLALHGTFGEDGQIQEILDSAEIMYTGSGARASRMAFDKSAAQPLFKKEGLNVPDFLCFDSLEEMALNGSFKLPAVVKPAKSGSSVGVTIVLEEANLRKAAQEAFCYSDRILIDEYVEGRELTVGILGDRPLPVVEIVAGRRFYDYQAKYQDTQTQYHYPAKLDSETTLAVQRLALSAYQMLGCEVMARADIILGRDGKLFLLEVNTIPGLTNKSLLPKAAKAAGMEFGDLCVKILELSLMKTAAEGIQEKRGL